MALSAQADGGQESTPSNEISVDTVCLPDEDNIFNPDAKPFLPCDVPAEDLSMQWQDLKDLSLKPSSLDTDMSMLFPQPTFSSLSLKDSSSQYNDILMDCFRPPDEPSLMMPPYPSTEDLGSLKSALHIPDGNSIPLMDVCETSPLKKHIAYHLLSTVLDDEIQEDMSRESAELTAEERHLSDAPAHDEQFERSITPPEQKIVSRPKQDPIGVPRKKSPLASIDSGYDASESSWPISVTSLSTLPLTDCHTDSLGQKDNVSASLGSKSILDIWSPDPSPKGSYTSSPLDEGYAFNRSSPESVQSCNGSATSELPPMTNSPAPTATQEKMDGYGSGGSAVDSSPEHDSTETLTYKYNPQASEFSPRGYDTLTQQTAMQMAQYQTWCSIEAPYYQDYDESLEVTEEEYMEGKEDGEGYKDNPYLYNGGYEQYHTYRNNQQYAGRRVQYQPRPHFMKGYGHQPFVYYPVDQPWHHSHKRSGGQSHVEKLGAGLDECLDQLRNLEKECKKAEQDLAKLHPTRRTSSGSGSSLKLPPNPTRIDKMVAEQLKEHQKVESLIGRIERVSATPMHPNVGVALDRWLACARDLQTLRKEETSNMSHQMHQHHNNKSYNEKDLVAFLDCIKELCTHTRTGRTIVWCAMQMLHADNLTCLLPESTTGTPIRHLSSRRSSFLSRSDSCSSLERSDRYSSKS